MLKVEHLEDYFFLILITNRNSSTSQYEKTGYTKHYYRSKSNVRIIVVLMFREIPKADESEQ